MNNKYFVFSASAMALIAGSIIKFNSNEYSYSPKIIKSINDSGNTVIKEEIRELSSKHIVFNLIADMLISGSICVITAQYIIKRLDKDENKEFQERIMQVQKDTSEAAIESVFKTLIPNEFYDIIKRDIFGCQLIRKDVWWDYEFTKNPNQEKTILKRRISYDLENISGATQEETINPSWVKSRKTTCYIEKISTTDAQNTEKTHYTYDSTKTADDYPICQISVARAEQIRVSIVLVQEFEFSEHILETHFSKHPIIDLRATVRLPKEYEFIVNSNEFSNAMKLIEKEDGFYSFKAIGAIYKGQGWEFLFQKKPDTPPVEEVKKQAPLDDREMDS